MIKSPYFLTVVWNIQLNHPTPLFSLVYHRNSLKICGQGHALNYAFFACVQQLQFVSGAQTAQRRKYDKHKLSVPVCSLSGHYTQVPDKG
jgi:hypothetical protein